MILKIQKLKLESDITIPWIIFGELVNVEYVTIKGEHFKEIVKDFDGNTPGEYPFDYTAIVDDSDRIVTVEATRKNGTRLGVAFNTSGYLLNDEGKTIERIG